MTKQVYVKIPLGEGDEAVEITLYDDGSVEVNKLTEPIVSLDLTEVESDTHIDLTKTEKWSKIEFPKI